MSYPLGSFPRYGHQERWAQERCERAIANSIATRQAKKRYRVFLEESGFIAFKEVLPWANKQLKGVDVAPELVLLGDSICQRMTRLIEKWNQDTEHRTDRRKQIVKVVMDTKRFLDQINGTGNQFVNRWAAATDRLVAKNWVLRWAAGV